MAEFTVSPPVRRTIRGKPSKHWYCQVYDPATGKQRWVSTGKTNRKAAVAARTQIEKRGFRSTDNALLFAALSIWLDLKRPQMSAGGHYAYRTRVDRWKRHFPSHLTCRQVTVTHIEGYFRERAEDLVGSEKKPRKVSGSTLNKERRQFGQFFRWAMGRGLCDENPAAGIGKFGETRHEIRSLDPDECRELLRACRDEYTIEAAAVRNAGGRRGGKKTRKRSKWTQTFTPPAWLHPLVFLGVKTGLRYGNLASLEWGDVDLRKGEIRLSPARTKTREGLTIPIDGETVELLKELKVDAASLNVLNLPERGNVLRSFGKAVRRAGLAPLRFHDLRATYITACRRAGIDLEVTAALVGHRTVQTTLKFYRSVDAEELRKAVAKKVAHDGRMAGEA